MQFADQTLEAAERRIPSGQNPFQPRLLAHLGNLSDLGLRTAAGTATES